jgi:hypothetical protein
VAGLSARHAYGKRGAGARTRLVGIETSRGTGDQVRATGHVHLGGTVEVLPVASGEAGEVVDAD